MAEDRLKSRNKRPASLNKPKKKNHFLKKLLRQFLVSLLILSVVFVPKILGLGFSSSIQEKVKSAITYKVETSNISNFLKDLFESIKTKGETKNVPSYMP